MKAWIYAKLAALWSWIKKSCWNSLTVALAYLYALGAALAQYGDVVVDALVKTTSDPAFDNLKNYLPPKWVSTIMGVTAALFFLARMRSIIKR